ncbi:MAG: prepilin-type N-terminal cleavage/methylation domain-containing protein [Opitutae bacterium]|nr:prepilin-type N-terminal cleavage/methylation domain-containing protein [Opitutae bacterium]
MTFRGSSSISAGPALLATRCSPALSLLKGFTLVELLIGMSLALTVMTAVLTSYIFLGRSLARLANQQTLESEARRTLAFFAQDVRMASGLSGTPSSSTVALTIPTGTGTNTITYYYNNTASDASVTVNGTSVTMKANALTRCVYNGSSVTSLTLLRYITTNSLSFTYYDSSENVYTSYTDYLTGIKRLALQFSTQTGLNSNGTQTPVYQFASSRLILRNRSLLP